MNEELKNIIYEGELLKGRALTENDDNLSEAETIDKILVEAEEWIKKANELLSSNGLNQDVDLDNPSWESLGSRSRDVLKGFIENRLQKLRPLINN